ncbi:DUF1080 domain-containing protein [Amnibacterium flavum]|uniref:3-keto-disaccharide hydrolase n=1 Tax=Amnibacterium flavum TaxID=2173173 RepID=UPI001F0C29D8|nr:DUF1080 domain-containing protein [Amnibacterium flavum]
MPRTFGAAYPGGPSIMDALDLIGMDKLEIDIAGPIVWEPEKNAAVWTVEDGAIVGRQNFPGSGYGGWLVSEKTYGDFELVLEAKPDWPADTGILLRRRADDWAGFQVLLDHREYGGIGGFYGNGLASFSALPFSIRSVVDGDGAVIGIEADDPATSLDPVTDEKISRLSYAAKAEDFLDVWRWNDWNEIRIRCVGASPVLTTWVNGLKIAELDTATIDSPHYSPEGVLEWLGPRGHIALEVHDNDPIMGEARWGRGAACRWRNITITELGSEGALA